jgi:peroxiredoxin
MTKQFFKISVQLAFALLLLLSSCKNHNTFVIKGVLKSTSQQYIYLSEFNFTESHIVDSVKIKSNGSFKFKRETNSPEFFQLSMNPNNFIILVINPGERISIKANSKNLAKDYYVEGSEGSSQIRKLTSQLSQTITSLDSIQNIVNTGYGKPGFEKEYNRLNAEFINKIKAQRNYSIKFIIEHLQSMAGIVAIYQRLNDTTYVLNQNRDIQYVNLVSDTLKKYYPDSKAVKILWNDRVRLNEAYNKLKLAYLSKSAKQLSYPDIALPGPEGDTITLSSIKGKCILINFWSPLNEDCIYVLRGLNQLYKDYHKKGFEIYNVALSEDKAAWQNAAKNGLSGINVIDVNAASSKFASVYNVTNLPASYLIGPKKDILSKDLFGEGLRKKLIELLK